MPLKNTLATSLVCLSLGLGANHPLGAQGIITGSLSGTVQDTTGAVIPQAQIIAKDENRGTEFNTVAKANGEFNFPDLPVGTYTVSIRNPGFADFKLTGVIIETGQVKGLGVEKLGTGGAVENIEVSTAQNLLETVQSQITTTFDTQQVADLPTGGGFDELALLIPGVVSTHGNNRANTNGAGISSNGQRGRSNNFEIDGQSNNDNSVTGPQVFFSNQDALQEVQIITNNFSAQYGRDAGSVVNYVTKSGTNAFHGSAFEFYEGSWLSSITQGNKGPQFGYCQPGQTPALNNCTTVVKPRFTQNTFGGTLGGPIIKDRLFGFGSAYFLQNYQGATTSNSNSIGATTGYTPTPAGVAALAAAFPTNPGIQSLVSYGPYAIPLGTVQQIPGSQTTVTFTDGTTSLPNVPVSLYSRTINPHNTDEEVLGRLDYQATPKDRFFLRYFYQLSPSFDASGTVVTGGLVNVTNRTHSVGADWTHTFGPRVVNSLRYSFQQSALTFDGGAFPSCTVSSFSSCPASLGVSTSSAYKQTATSGALMGTAIQAISSFGLSTSYPQGRIVKDTQVQDNLSLSLGRHSITVGGAFELQNSPNVFLPNISGGYTFFGGNGVLQDSGQVGLAIGSPNIPFREPDVSAYFQDDFRASASLTFNLGIRWEFFSQSVNLLHNESLANQTAASPLWNPALPQSETVFPQVPQDYKHFEPRLGFAYNPQSFKSMVIRGGYSINIAPAFYNIFLNSYGSAPVVLAATITGCNNTTKLCTPQGGANFANVHALDNVYLTGTAGTTSTLNPGNFNQTLVTPNFNQPITETYTLGIQQEVGRFAVAEVRYTGAHTSHDFQSLNANPAIGAAATVFPGFFGGRTGCTTPTLTSTGGASPGLNSAYPVAGIANGRVDCNNSNVRTRANTSFEIYNGLQTSVKTRDYHGLTANAAYTFSRTVDNASEIFGTSGVGATVAFSQNPLDPNVGERGVSGNSYPNVGSLGLTYVDPHFKSDHSFVGKLLGGFQLNTIYVFNSGQPYTPYQAAAPTGFEANFCDYLFDATFAGPTSCRPVLSNPAAPLGTVGYNSGSGIYRNLAGAIIQPSSVHFLVNNVAEAITKGTPYPGIGRNTLRGGTYNNLDASVFKNNKINERFNLQLQATFFNALNRAFYGAPDAAIEDAAGSLPTFTTFINDAGTNRNVQLGARLLF